MAEIEFVIGLLVGEGGWEPPEEGHTLALQGINLLKLWVTILSTDEVILGAS